MSDNIKIDINGNIKEISEITKIVVRDNRIIFVDLFDNVYHFKDGRLFKNGFTWE